MTNHAPDPQNKRKEELKDELTQAIPAHNDIGSSEESSDDEASNGGYQLLSTAEVHFHDDQSTDSEDEIIQKIQEPPITVEPLKVSESLKDVVSSSNEHSAAAINEELIRSTMKKITLKNIPQWAQEITDDEWKEVVKKTVSKTDKPE